MRLDANGDVSSIFDKKLQQGIAGAPAPPRHQDRHPLNWPAWNMDWAIRKSRRRAPTSPARPRFAWWKTARSAWPLEVTRETEDSKFVQTIRLSAGDAGNRVEFGNVIDWKTNGSQPQGHVSRSTASNPKATYNWDVGTVQRATETERQFEVASHQWIDLTDKCGSLRRHRALRLQNRLGQTRRPHPALDPDPHARHPRRLPRSRHAGHSAATRFSSAWSVTPATGARVKPIGRASA